MTGAGKDVEGVRDLQSAIEAEQHQKERLRITLASIGDAVISTDAQGNVTLLNGVAESLTGWTQDEALGKPLPEVFQIVNETTRQPIENPALRALAEGTIVGLANHTVLISKDGTERPIDDSAAPIRSEDGTVVGAILVFRDITERRQTEAALAQLAAIIESSDDAIVSKSLDGTIRSWNASAERLFGYSAEEAIGQPITLIIPPDRWDEEQQILRRIERGERLSHFETVRRHKDGRRLDISLTVSPLRNREGQVTGASKIARDITAQKQAEREQRRLQAEVEAERARLAEVFQSAPSFLAVLRGPEHVFELANDRYYELIGHRDLIGKPVREALPEIEGQGFFEKLDEVYREGKPFVAADMRAIVKRGPEQQPEERVLEFVYQPLRQPSGEITGIIVQGIDLTERKQAENALARVTAESERQRRLYETILASVPDFVYVFGLDHRILYANKALLGLWNRDLKDTVGKYFMDLGYEQWHAEMHEREIDQVRDTKAPLRGEVPFEGAYGRRIYDYIFVPVLGADGEVEAVAGTTRDVTERRRMEDLLRETDRNKDEFIALLAHELRNPLSPLRNGLQVIKLSKDNPEAIAEARGIMERQLEHMVRLIDDLLDISRLSRNKMDLRRSRVLLEEVVTSAVETAKSAIDDAGHHLTISLPPEPVYLDADLTRLAQVFSNLLTNSAKYTQDGGQISLKAERHGDEVSISVQDTGIGIPAKSLPKVFDMFSQVDRNLERSSGGLGIGLALVKGLVEMHQGKVTASSQGEGQGSTFTVTLPVLDDDAEAIRETADEASLPRNGNRRRVLVVDDNQDSAEMMATILQLLGHEVSMAHDGLAAVEEAARFRPHVILMDVGMPKLNGHEATRRIRGQETDNQPIIIALTGWGQASDRAQSKAAGCDGHLVKPVSLPDLEKLLAELEGSSRGNP